MPTSERDSHRPSEPRPFNPWNPVAAICRCWRWALPIGLLLAAIVAAVMVFSYVPTYKANCLLVANQDYVVFKGVMPTLQNLAKSERNLIFSPIVLDPVLNEPGIRSAASLADPANAEQNLQDNLTVESGGRELALVISYVDTDPKAAAMVCNAVVASYLGQRSAFDNKRVSNMEYLLEPEIQRWELEVSEKQRKLQALKRAMGQSPGDSLRIEGDLEFLKNLQQRANEVSLEMEIMDAKISVAKSSSNEKQDDSGADDEPSQAEIEMDRERELLSAELKVLKQRLLEEKSKMETIGATTAELQFAQDELSIANGVLTKLRNRVAEIRTERRRESAVQLLAQATTPRVPVHPLPVRRIALLAAVAFLVPFMLGFLLGFKPPRQTIESGDNG